MKPLDKFCVFIMVHGRPDKMWTYNTLRKAGYTGSIYLICDNLDPSANEYVKKYGNDQVIVFNKMHAACKYDSGDNSWDLRSTLYAANTSFELAKELGIDYFSLMCDDYLSIEHRYLNEDGSKLLVKKVEDMDKIFTYYVEFIKNTNFKSIAFAQGGDFIGGVGNRYAVDMPLIRKAMNSFICCTNRPFQFVGRLNEDATTYTLLGSKGELFGTIPFVSIVQQPTQNVKGGLTDAYKDNGTYVKSFFSVMYNPSSVKVSMIYTDNLRLHHNISWANAVPVIIDEKHRKSD